MKNPRVSDFDPSNKKAVELASPLDGMPQIEKPQPPIDQGLSVKPDNAIPFSSPRQENNQPYHSTIVRPSVRTPVRRTTTRYAFEFYHDQVENLRRFSLEEKSRGEKGSMSQMIREALDAYIAKRKRQE
jgi:hypothetical protein